MIKRFRHKGLKRLFEHGSLRGISADMAKRLRIRLDIMNRAKNVSDVNLPGFDLHELKDARKGTWSVKVTANWRLTFRFENGDAFDVDLEDYH